MKPSRVPLFPLELVLFPGMALPLHIFEPRYKLMIARCIEEPCVFCVAMASKGVLARTGCTAEVVKVVERYADGRMDILTVGRDVCLLREVVDEEPYSEGIVEYLEDSGPTEPHLPHEELLEAFQSCHEIIFRQPLDLEEPTGETQLSYLLASELPIELTVKQELLEMRMERDRRARLHAHLREWLPSLQRIENFRKKATGNGHSHH
jgi:ATP-dependent Lon protease